MPQRNVLEAVNSLYHATGNTWISESAMRDYLKKLHYNPSLSFFNPLIDDGKFYLARKDTGELFLSPAILAQAEQNIAIQIFRIMNADHPTFPDSYLDNLIDIAQKKRGIELHIDQRKAVKMACNNLFFVLTGGPGTGKTCTISIMNDVQLAICKDLQILYTAPTGKAARRITESTGFQAGTLHKRLGLTKDNLNPQMIAPAFKVVTVDEVSMVDTLIAEALFKAIRTGTRLILIGDVDQLPSVGPGAVLRDLIASNCVPVARLTKTFRQEGDSILMDNILKVQKGICDLKAGEDFTIAVPHKDVSAKDLLLHLYMKEVKEWGIENVMCLTPFRQKGDTCSNEMNHIIQSMVNPTGNSLSYNGTTFRKKDIVMQLENQPKCANGDVGTISAVYKHGITVRYVDAEVDYSTNMLNQINLAYAMSIHKSQGSEAPSIVTTLLNEHELMLQRNLLYTAITRAKKRCSMICDPDAVFKAINNEASGKRITMLQEQLRRLN